MRCPTLSLFLLSATLVVSVVSCVVEPPPRAPLTSSTSAPLPASAPAAAPPVEHPAAAARPTLPPLAFIDDDVPAALARARAEGKALFVDAWAPWCHTCLSMKHYVLTDPSLRPLADRMVFAAIDTDRPENAPFLERHELSAWPTFFVIDPARDEVVGLWPGSASVKELREIIDDALRAIDTRAVAAQPADHPYRLLVEAKRAQSAGDHAAAAAAYSRAIEKGGAGWVRLSDALLGELEALSRQKSWAACAELGKAHVGEVKGSALPADFSGMLLHCASNLPDGDAQKAARSAGIARLRSIVRDPPADASADDRADAWGLLAEGLKDQGDLDGARAANEAKLAILERAAKEAPTSDAAASYDYGRAMAYLALSRGEEAIAMLRQREAQVPGSYEPPARLASVLHAMGREEEALAAAGRAIERAYGPRRLRYLKLRGDIQEKLGDRAARLATLREEVAGYEALAKGHVREGALEEAKRRLAEAEKAKPGPAKPAGRPAPGGAKKR